MIIGIDLGTTFSALSRLNSSGIPVLCPDRRNNQSFHTPSLIHVKNGVHVGDSVEKFLLENPSLNVCRFAKRSMGSEEIIYKDGDGFGYPAHGVSAFVLRKLKLDAEAGWGEKIEKAVISIPAHFNEAQRQATINAGLLAELPIVGLVEEPVAAATFCASTASFKKDERTLFVFDLGGGTLDCTVLQSTPDGLYVLATEGAENIGGKNFDELIMDMILDQFSAQFADDDPKDDPTAMQSLRMFSTAAKLELATMGVRKFQKPIMLKGRPLQITITRDQFDYAAETLLEGCTDVCETVLRSANLGWSDITSLMLTGGGSQLPCVESCLKRVSSLDPSRIVRNQPRASVAYGAALLAEQLHGDGKSSIAPPLKQTVSTNELGIAVRDPKTKKQAFECLVSKNLPLPTASTKTVYANTMDSADVIIRVQQRKDVYSSPEDLGKFHFGPLPRSKRNVPLELKLGYDEVGRVAVMVQEPSGRSLEKIMEGTVNTNRLSDLSKRITSLPII